MYFNHMIYSQRIKFYFIFRVICICSFGCEPHKTLQTTESVTEIPQQSQIEKKLPAPKPTQEFEVPDVPSKPATVGDQSWIATLKSSQNRVDFKSKSESTWQAVTSEMNFFKYDSIQTHKESTALVRYQSKSEIEVKEKSLLVFDEDPGTKKKKIDRVILKTGELLGKTNTELWVLTEAGLVQISAGKLKSAKARIQFKNEQFKVSVDQGTALVTVKSKNNEIQKISVGQKNTLELNTQKQISPLIASNELNVNFQEAIAVAESIAQPTEQKVILGNADETEMTKKNVYQLNGKISAFGAKLLINGELVQTSPDLSFTKSIQLTKGSNLIVLQLIRSDFTTQFVRKKVVFED